MRLAAVIITIGIAMPQVGCKTTNEGSETKNFFENSRRRRASSNDLNAMGKIDGCASFFVENTQGRTYMMTARHCLNSDSQNWCDDGGEAYSFATERTGTCLRVVAGDNNRDLVLLEMSGIDQPSDATLRLAGYTPKKGSQLKMTGFPSDKFNEREPAISENCWVTAESAPNPYDDQNDETALHNCSVYAGKSGGPIVLEGTREVIAEPSDYDSGYATNDFYPNKDAHGADGFATMALLSGFIQKHASKLANAGVVIVNSQEHHGTSGDYLAVGLYKSADMPDCDFYVTPQYMTGSELTGIEVEYRGSGCGGTSLYDCDGGFGTCRNDSGRELLDITRKGFLYRSPSGVTARFKT